MLSLARPATARLARPLARSAIILSIRAEHTLPPLPYAYDALEPYISKEIMTLHHDRHHKAYVDGLNAAESSYAATDSVKERIKLQPALKFNGGGHINHTLFWKNLAPAESASSALSAGPLKDAIERDFGSLEALQKEMNTKTLAIQGSGWSWLGVNPSTKKLEIVTTANQDPLLTHVPIIGIDIWEHAFYLDYRNVKAEYLKAIWNVINFEEANERFTAAV
ncbi:manganese superoxide dismutase [Calocera viscosa TUFC12733]|uniref:Superoxide dismutase n=1 Tax=Calocera viscosa (strain TUFC12733) TaxID=1330018 RepID=A0A167NFI4_CALVF|nr:manganese superoxide dismutase [Calocera viscosa TUFC12733]